MKLVYQPSPGADTQQLLADVSSYNVKSVGKTSGCIEVFLDDAASAGDKTSTRGVCESAPYSLTFVEEVAGTYVQAVTPLNSIRMKAPDGGIWGVSVDNSGVLITTEET